MPTPIQTLFASYQSSGPSAVFTNPVASGLSTLQASIATASAAIPGIMTLLPGDVTAIQADLTSLNTAASSMLTHTNLISGLTQPTTSGVPYLQGLVALAGTLDGFCAGIYGSSATLIPTMITALGAGSAITAINTYVNSIVNALTLGSTTPAAVEAALVSNASSLNSYVSNDNTAYSNAQVNVTQGSAFISIAGFAKSTNTAVEALMAEIATPTTITTLKSAY